MERGRLKMRKGCKESGGRDVRRAEGGMYGINEG